MLIWKIVDAEHQAATAQFQYRVFATCGAEWMATMYAPGQPQALKALGFTSRDRKGLETRLDELQRKLATLDKERTDIERNISHVERVLRGDALEAQALGMGYPCR